MKASIRRRLEREKRKIIERLEPLIGGATPRRAGQPELRARRVVYELAQRSRAIPCGGVGAIMCLIHSVGLERAINERARLLKVPRPYLDSDHVLNIALNLLCGGEVLDDIEVRRNDRTFLDALGARAIPDPTTAGDYLRRFDAPAVWRLMHAINHVRAGVWQRSRVAQGTARIDADGSIVPTTGECKQGMALSFKGIRFNPPPPPPAPGGTSVPLWAQYYYNFPGVLVMQGDGNLVLYDSLGGDPVWSSNTWGHPGVSLSIQNDGNLVIYDFNGAVLWKSDTCCH